MAFPQQPEKIAEDRQALAPYNFVPLPERVVVFATNFAPDHDQFHSDRLSGHLACVLTTESPLYTRAGLPLEHRRQGVQTKDNPAFFYTLDENKPVIPGSSLRGLLRGLVEIVTFSRVGPVSENGLIYRAVGDTTSHGEHYRALVMRNDGERDRKKFYTPLMRGGYMVNEGGEWAIRPAKEIEGTTYAHLAIDESFFSRLSRVKNCQNAFHLHIATGPYQYQAVRGGFLQIKFAPVLRREAAAGPGLRPAVLARSGPMNSKRTEAVIYEVDETADPLPLTDELIDAYRGQLSKEQEKLLGKGGVLREGQPVFYILKEDGSVHFFGHCRMLRMPYTRSPRSYVPPSLRREEGVDLAEAIFGYVRAESSPAGQAAKECGYAGRIFFSDAKLESEQADVWLTPERTIVPKILAGPKPTTFQHYLVQTRPNKKQVGQTRDGRPRYAIELSDYASPTPGETVIRGHKLYWHKGPLSLDTIREAAELKGGDTQHTRIQPVKPGVRFHFQIHFENLRPLELGALLWVLDVAAQEPYRLKIGMGKPLGMGAIKIESKLHLMDRQARYRQLLDGDNWAGMAAPTSSQRQQWYVAHFEEMMLSALSKLYPTARRLADLDRIQALLTLLSWPGPDPGQTRYMQIDLREYRERPVLPLPAVVGRKRAKIR